MSGHNKWASIKHKKAATDSKRGKVFTKIIREMVVAAREGGGIIENNARLRKAVTDAREANMPQDNIKKAIQRGTGEIPGAVYEEITYEGYGPAGVALIVETTTDNKNRTASDIRKIFSKHSGSMGETGCVGWMFTRKGFISLDKSVSDEDTIMTLALENGADDFIAEDDVYEIYTKVEDLETVKNALTAKNMEIAESEISMIPQTYVKLEGANAEHMLKLMDELEEYDDVKNVFANFDISKEDMEKFGA
ncbi:MAG: YebC/PmpR family DNA-binding transcriptional regulator [Endomicrobiia bacterium]|nr:YebC/PmpR family DNA-binding transcriptional regulator [Endomicrobiaceae bacterium]MDD3053795.1 YebC/PmpR family DNA-binding transcriptional regulator [Endomicrobiaceae bacterium]MDD3922859.1 YebC/PmpR family DNA-binding transcriptional regulator [Endomicrobiaceae bacterium]MDD5101652.1 YebC/PmpR family DNA-binding transcriptional regulator [Endomicrobiaceae bacterium]